MMKNADVYIFLKMNSTHIFYDNNSLPECTLPAVVTPPRGNADSAIEDYM